MLGVLLLREKEGGKRKGRGERGKGRGRGGAKGRGEVASWLLGDGRPCSGSWQPLGFAEITIVLGVGGTHVGWEWVEVSRLYIETGDISSMFNVLYCSENAFVSYKYCD